MVAPNLQDGLAASAVPTAALCGHFAAGGADRALNARVMGIDA